MAKKFFSLIHGEEIHIAPGTKVIPKEEISKIVDAGGVLEGIKIDAEKYRQEVVKECEKLKEVGQKEGFEEGYKDWVEKIADLEEEIKKVRKDLEQNIVPVALKAAKKIVAKELEVSPQTIVDIVENSLKSVSQHKKIQVYVNQEDYEYVEKERERLKNVFERLEALSISVRDDIQPGGCVIETEGGIINAQLENQWLVLERAFQKLIIPSSTETTQNE